MRYSEIVRERAKELAEQKKLKDAGIDPRAIIPTGLTEVDKRAGVKLGIMTLVGATTGEGKDLYMLQLMESAAQAGYTVEVLSMEDPKERTADRSLSKQTGINNARMQSVEVDEKELARIQLAAMESEEWGERIEFHQGSMTAAEATALMTASTADLRIVNYLQAFPDSERSLERTLAQFAWDMNSLAQTDKCAVVCFSQTNVVKIEERGLELMQRSQWRDSNAPPNIEGFRPYGASDLAWCTAAGIRAKDLQFLFRPGRYLKRAGKNVNDDRLEISRPKNNFGSEGVARVGIDLKTARLYNLESNKK